MGDCCAAPADPERRGRREGRKSRLGRTNPFSIDYDRGPVPGLVVLRNPTGRQIGSRYELGQMLDRRELGSTSPATPSPRRSFARPWLIEDVRREVEIIPPTPNIVSLNDTYQDDGAVHLVMELCGGG
ncbi:hypothetical protein GW17_00039145 [Ensete ventricosum]|nr:hypothetical protein GW17_00039145 [Ensete ventricosum]